MSNILKIIFICCLFSACKENDMAKIKALFDEKNVDVEVADSIQFIYKEGKYARAIVTGKTIKRYTKTQNKIEFSDGLLVKFYEQLKLISVLKADYAENNETEKIILVSGNVYMENERFERLTTSALKWDIKTKKISTEKAITIRTPDHTIYGIGFDANEDFSNYTIRKVKGIVAVDNTNGFK